MRRAVNEIAGLVLKACRGAGLPLGVAEDIGQAAAHMTPEALSDLAGLLSEPALHGRLTGLCCALDARACGQDDALPDCGSALVTAVSACRAGSAPPPPGPREISGATWSLLERFAARTYVPATEESRRSGAGAGQIDND